MDKYTLSERDICTKFITPALRRAGWDEMLQIREEVSLREVCAHINPLCLLVESLPMGYPPSSQ